MDELNELKNALQELKLNQKDIKHDIRNLESRILITEKDILIINKQLNKITSNTIWILRLIIGGLLTALLDILLKNIM